MAVVALSTAAMADATTRPVAATTRPATSASRPAASALSTAVSTASIDHSDLSALLARYVVGERVAYRRWKASAADMARLDAYIARLARAEASALSRTEKLALYINAYNALTLKSVLDAYPVRSIKNIPGVWTRRKWKVGGRELTIDQIENVVLRGELREPRIHFAIVCASVGCPSIRPWAFTGARVNDQLDSVARDFLNAPARARVDVQRRRLFLSSIFNWFAEDFVRSAGSVQAYVAQYRSSEEAAALREGRWSLSYDNYDWSLNGAE
jgi:hypothetical protein